MSKTDRSRPFPSSRSTLALGALLGLAALSATVRSAIAADPPVSAPVPPAPPSKPVPPVAPPAPAPAPAPQPETAPDAPPAPAKVPLPPGIVARVRKQDVTLDEFRGKLVEATKDEMNDPRSGPATVLAVLVEETVVRQEAERLGIRVTTDDYAKAFDELDRRTRLKTQGKQTLEDVIRSMNTPPEEFRARLEDSIRKERVASDPSHLGATLPKDERARLAQIEIVVGELIAKAKVERDGLPAGVVARVNGETISTERFGAQLYLRLADSEVRRRLNEHCLFVLFEQEGLRFSPAQVDEAIALERPLWTRMADEAIDAAHRAMQFEDFVALRYQAPIAELRSSPYRRGLFALKMRYWKQVAEDKVLAEWTAGADKQYGASIVVTEFVVSFHNPKALIEQAERRPKGEALRIASDIARRGRGGEGAPSLLREIQALKSRSIVATRRALLNMGNDTILFDKAKDAADGSWIDPIEALSEYHVLYKEVLRPAPTYVQMKDVVRHNIVDRMARDYVESLMREQVQVAK